MTNIPIYRGLKLGTISEYVVGYLHKSAFDRITINDNYCMHDIDPSTLSIHFPDMLASDSDRLLPNGEKDLRMFASLSKDGKGGDILKCYLGTNIESCTCRTETFKYTGIYRFTIVVYDMDAYPHIKISGIQQ
jgi:hypothetical protein